MNTGEKKLSKSNFRNQIFNGQLSTKFAFKEYDLLRTTISYWLRNCSNLAQQNIGRSKNKEIKNYKSSLKN
jgi:hypothetical protein|tara:strand:+ start:2547 stop:2759 length:213 start_codon:yes stop_codon:yes gene_type:complete